jgi:signal transduction histidine kinase
MSRRDAWFAADPDAMRMNAAPRTAAYHLGVAWLLVIVGWTPWGRALLGVDPLYLTLVTVAFSVDLVELARRVADGALFRADAWPRRLLTVFVLFTYTSSFAAPSTIEASPAWAFFVMAGAVAGLIGTGLGPGFATVLLVSGPGFHLLAAPSVTPLSLGVSLGAAFFSGLAALLGRSIARLAIELELRAEARSLVMAEARADARRLAGAMSLHDGLSGMLFAVRAQLESAEQVDTVRAPIDEVVRRARDLVLPMSTLPDVPMALRRVAALHGVPLTVVGAPPDTDPVEASDLAFGALELVANALRHREVSSLSVTFHRGADHGLSVRADGPLSSRATIGSGGRGTRHLALRARAWGGTSTRTDEPSCSVAEMRWPKPTERIGPLWVAFLVPMSALPFVALFSSADATAERLAYVATVAVLTSVGLAYDARALRRAATSLMPAPLPAAPLPLSHASDLLVALDALASAVEEDRIPSVRARMADVGRALTALLSNLEAAAEPPSAGRAAPRSFTAS